MFLRIISKVNKISTPVKFYRTSAVLSKIVQFNLSDIGEGIREVTVREWSVKTGDIVAQFDDICTVESDKATVNITSRYDGKILKLYHEIGEKALVGNPLVDIDVEDNDSSERTMNPNLEETLPTHPPVHETGSEKEKVCKTENIYNEANIDRDIRNKRLATPAVRRIAKENNILISNVAATGRQGRVLKEDILKHLEKKSDSINLKEVISPSSQHTEKSVQISGIKKVMVKTMTKSHSIPTFGYCDEIDVGKLMLLMKDVKEMAKLRGINLTLMPFFIKSLSKSLSEFPILNSSVDEKCEIITYKPHHNIGIAMDTKEGLIVPNIKNVEQLSVVEIALELKRLLENGRDLKLGPSDMTGGTITISNIGAIGGTYTRPLILPPEVAIVALGKTRLFPALTETGEISRTYQVAASWTADHRIIDGATLARFNNKWKEYIENPNYLLLDL